MNTKSITRRNFIKRTATTAVAAAFAVSAFDTYAFRNGLTGSCFCLTYNLLPGEKITVIVPVFGNPPTPTIDSPRPGTPGPCPPDQNLGTWRGTGNGLTQTPLADIPVTPAYPGGATQDQFTGPGTVVVC